MSCAEKHAPDDDRLGEPLCPDCYDYTGSVLFNACAPELWRRFTITLRRTLARQAGLTNKVYRLVTQTPERLSLVTLAALCDILGCQPGDLVEPVAAAAGPRAAREPGLLPRPRRARVLPGAE